VTTDLDDELASARRTGIGDRVGGRVDQNVRRGATPYAPFGAARIRVDTAFLSAHSVSPRTVASMAAEQAHVVIDARNPKGLAQFWADALGWQLIIDEPDEVGIQGGTDDINLTSLQYVLPVNWLMALGPGTVRRSLARSGDRRDRGRRARFAVPAHDSKRRTREAGAKDGQDCVEQRVGVARIHVHGHADLPAHRAVVLATWYSRDGSQERWF
jgi:hypothetical protein